MLWVVDGDFGHNGSATIERAPALGKVAIRVRLEDSSVFGLNRVTGRGRKVCCVSIPVKLAARLHPLARIPALVVAYVARITGNLGAVVPFAAIAAHRLHFATHALAAERLTDKHQQQQDSKHGVNQSSFGAAKSRAAALTWTASPKPCGLR